MPSSQPPTTPEDQLPRGAGPTTGWLGASVQRYLEQSMPVYAAAVSFWAMVSLVPLVAMVVFAVAVFVPPETAESFIENITVAVPGETVALLAEQVRAWVSVSRGISTVGLVIAVAVASWGGSVGAANLLRAINIAHGFPPRNIVERRITAMISTIGAMLFVVPIVTLVAATPAAMAASGAPSGVRWIIGVARWPVVMGLFVAALAAMYWVAPSNRPRFRVWSMGAGVALLLFVVASAIFSLYVANVESYDSSYGSLGTVVVTMLWLYVTTSAILAGAEIDAVRSDVE